MQRNILFCSSFPPTFQNESNENASSHHLIYAGRSKPAPPPVLYVPAMRQYLQPLLQTASQFSLFLPAESFSNSTPLKWRARCAWCWGWAPGRGCRACASGPRRASRSPWSAGQSPSSRNLQPKTQVSISHRRLQGDPSGWLKPPVDLDLGCSAILPGQ